MPEAKPTLPDRSEGAETVPLPLSSYDLADIWIPDGTGRFYELQSQALQRITGSEQLDGSQAIAALSPDEAGVGIGAAQKKLKRLREESRLLALPLQEGGYRYPSFQFDRDNSCLYGVAEEVNSLLRAARDPWWVASWWLTKNGRTDGLQPADLIGGGRDEALLSAARSALNR
ncbi:hypothetical protein F4X86_03875 [Candidatus Saccharibacteria bacterium]|nr:hypothetical protein [Candidatus Saccharibacteria bacterium]